MKLIIEETTDCEETEIRIRCGLMTPELQELISLIRLRTFSVEARRDGEVFYLRPEDILYFESVDGRTFAYTAEGVYELPLKLSQLEDELAKTSFQRVSRTTVLNLAKLRSVKGLINGRMLGTMENGEQVVINRSHVRALRLKLQQGR
ncbi:MAG: LytTR family transcriptional regulator [Clostridia bacterium]|nr:LytTR family transcriptional regulator [Clostridia bacterium]